MEIWYICIFAFIYIIYIIHYTLIIFNYIYYLYIYILHVMYIYCLNLTSNLVDPFCNIEKNLCYYVDVSLLCNWFLEILFGFSLKRTSCFVNLARIISCTEKTCRLKWVTKYWVFLIYVNQVKAINILTFLQTIFMFWSPFYLISSTLKKVPFCRNVLSCIIFGAYFSKCYCCVLLFCQSKMKIRCNSCFISLHRNFLKTFSLPFLYNETMKSNMTKRCAKYDAANYENK